MYIYTDIYTDEDFGENFHLLHGVRYVGGGHMASNQTEDASKAGMLLTVYSALTLFTWGRVDT